MIMYIIQLLVGNQSLLELDHELYLDRREGALSEFEHIMALLQCVGLERTLEPEY